MTEIQIPYLPSAQFFKIRCRLGINEQDVIGDSDRNPQIRTIGGTVTIFSMVPRFRYTEADGRSRMVYTKTETYNIQTSTGELFDADGNIEVFLLNTNSPRMDPQGWTYRATVRPNGGEPFDVNIPSDPEGGVFDLGDGLVFTPSTGITTLETRVKALEDAQGSTPGLPVNFDEAVQDIVGSMVTGAGGTYNDVAGTITLPSGGGSSTITADDTPAAPAEGESASYFVTPAVSWPAGLVWSTDPDGGTAPTITGTALVSLFTVGGVTRAIMGATFPVVVPGSPLAAAILALSPVGYWRLDETAGTQATDYSGNARHGTYGGDYTLAANGGLVTLGATGYVDCGDVDDWSYAGATNGFTVFVLATRPSIPSSASAFMSKRGAGNAEWMAFLSGGANAGKMTFGGYTIDGLKVCTEERADSALTDIGSWNAYTFAAQPPALDARIAMYENGTLLTSSNVGGTVDEFSNGTASLRIGGVEYSGWGSNKFLPWNGSIGHVAVFRSTLTAGQVATLAAAAAAEVAQQPPPPLSLPYTVPASAPYNVPQYVTTPTYEGSGNTVHVDIVDFWTAHGIRQWRGFRFWMAHTPFPDSRSVYENPSIIASNDGLTWVTPAGLTNPLYPTPATKWNSDTDLSYDPTTDQLVCVFRTYEDGAHQHVRMRSSDGVTWTAARRLIGWSAPKENLSPALVRAEDGTWMMFGIDVSRTLRRWTAPTIDGPWSAPVTCTGFPVTSWHLDVIRVGDRLLALVDDGKEIFYSPESEQGMYAATSTDGGLTWTRNPNRLIVLGSGLWDNLDTYRGGLQLHENGTHVRVWYCGRKGTGPSDSWHVGLTEIPLTEWPA